jgi:hypothetical protein
VIAVPARPRPIEIVGHIAEQQVAAGVGAANGRFWVGQP